MDSVCPSAIDLSALNNTVLTDGTFYPGNTFSSTTDFPGLPSYDTTKLASYSYTIQGTQMSATLFSILSYAPTGRYDLSSLNNSGYWPASRNTNIDTNALINTFNTTNVPGKTTKIITPQNELTPALDGTVANQKTAVSYDFLYSLQFEFCFWAKVYKILIGDYIKVQKATLNAGFTSAKQTENLRKIVNALNSVNLRLTDLTKLAQAVAKSQRDGVSAMNTNVNRFLQNISQNVAALDQNRRDLTSADVDSRLKARMLEYSEEKNTYANQMLAMYGFANLIALGLLFYIYRG